MSARGVLVLKRIGLVAACVGVLVFTGCESDDADDDTGSSVVQGYVYEFHANGVAVRFEPARGSVWARLGRLVGDLLAAPACAAVGGVSVAVPGTAARTVSAASGYFVLSGVPSGPRQLVFTYNGQSATYGLDVPEHTRIEIAKVRVLAGGVVRAEGKRNIRLPTPAASTAGKPSSGPIPASNSSKPAVPAENSAGGGSAPTSKPPNSGTTSGASGTMTGISAGITDTINGTELPIDQAAGRLPGG